MDRSSVFFFLLGLVLLCSCSQSSAVEVTYDGRAIKIDGERCVLFSGSIHYPRSTSKMWPDLIQKAKDGGLEAIETHTLTSQVVYDFSGNLNLSVPYVCAEWNYGGFPVWLHNMPGIALRTDNEIYKNEMQNFTTLIVDMVRKEKLFASQGGPIILAQINTCNGWYCDSFTPNNPNVPKMWNWTGWFKHWGGKVPHRTAEDLEFSVVRFFQFGGTGGSYITTSYDYDAPLDKFGNLNQPKWGHLKQLYLHLKSMEKSLTSGDISSTDFGNSVTATKYDLNGIASANSSTDATITFQGNQYYVPAWSVSILPDCKNEVNTQISVIVKKSNKAEEEPSALNWVWRTKNNKGTALQGLGPNIVEGILEQKAASNDTSDYQWYMTSVDLEENDPIVNQDLSLRVNTTGHGHVLYAYVNGKHVGSQLAKYGSYNFVFEHNITLNIGSNQVSLISATIGLRNYGAMYDQVYDGINSVEIVGTKGDETLIKDLSSHNWTYKTTFKAPLGKDSVVVDLQGIGKGCNATCDYRGAYTNSKCATNGGSSQRWYHVPRSFLREDKNALVLFEEIGGNPFYVNFETLVGGSWSCRVIV
ncbi:hypothetical protein GIB67_032944 [Kingdonia uniflora]|uniref:beta-galactosidase n=1 Tax=Kingdonia uniflora TaxID=39325 RepID=A0A7J7MYK0_9MAGN|nr:hypothetical protein GIB67_032944 [Kingdonia uniflora]